MFDYIWLAFTAWFMGFFPLFEIYIAVPAAMAMGLDMYSALFWSWLGNFLVIPFIAYFYDWLTRFPKINRYFTRLASSRSARRMNKGGFTMVLLATPVIGAWAVGVAGKVIGMDRGRLFTSSAVSIAIFGLILAVLTRFGIDFVQ
ncbi:small multi-drug export protein [Alkalicoccus luteus]|uniref:Small multi-drug export protein n=1 Tax=Alkalicoccus luteus TaxID=1237094 RepID=A0A969TTN5_9BACI|nr:small multi-drug export protein [Alkalicoccus luteus]NJP36187.1 small multi-drug export protein [Alkalicoccus luteus]